MAIDTLAKQAKASAVGAINRKFRKVAGNIAGLIDSGRGQSSADSDPINRTKFHTNTYSCLLYTSPSPRDEQSSRMPSSA